MVTYYKYDKIEIIHLKDCPIVYDKHNHVSTYTIGIVLGGSVQLSIESQIQQLSANDFFVIAPYQSHALQLPENHSLLTFCLHKDQVNSMNEAELFAVASNKIKCLYPNLDMSLLESAIIQTYNNRLTENNNNLFESADFLWKYPESCISTQMLADQTGLSKYHYIRTFKNTIGLTPHKFHVQNKIRKAQRLIEAGAPIGGLAFDLGFYDQSHFIKCFKNIVGITPSEYKQSLVIIQN